MATTRQRPNAQEPATRPASADRLEVIEDGGWRWRRVVRLAGAADVITLALTMALVIRGVDPIAIVLAALLVCGLWWSGLEGRKGGLIMTTIVVALIAVANASFGGVGALRHPASTFEFIQSAVMFVAAVVAVIGLVGALGQLRRGAEPPVGRALTTTLVAGGLVALAVVTGAAAGLAYDSASARPGDLRVTMKDTKFSTARLSAPAGRISVFAKNEDGARHTFTLVGRGVELDVPAGRSARLTFTLPGGTYRYVCSLPGHSSTMHGVLVVTR